MVLIKDINKNFKKNLFDPIDKTKNKLSSLLKDFKKNKVKKDLALQKQLEKETSFSKKINHWKWKARKKEWREKTKNRSSEN